MARQELHSDTLKIEQLAPIHDTSTYDGDVIIGEKIGDADYLDELAFMEEPVTIRLEPSSDANAAGAFPAWCNGKGAEVFQNGRWIEITYLPVGCDLTIKRKILEVIIRAKIDTVHTKIIDDSGDRPNNVVHRFTRSVHSYSIMDDRNPRGDAWAREMTRRNL